VQSRRLGRGHALCVQLGQCRIVADRVAADRKRRAPEADAKEAESKSRADESGEEPPAKRAKHNPSSAAAAPAPASEPMPMPMPVPPPAPTYVIEYEPREWSDVTITLRDWAFRCHRTILVPHSKVFAALSDATAADFKAANRKPADAKAPAGAAAAAQAAPPPPLSSETPTWPLPDSFAWSGSDLRILLDVIYAPPQGKVELTHAEWRTVCELAHYFDLTSLHAKAQAHVQRHFSKLCDCPFKAIGWAARFRAEKMIDALVQVCAVRALRSTCAPES
jgi:hypothetical protein